jgi:hypothetical protein
MSYIGGSDLANRMGVVCFSRELFESRHEYNGALTVMAKMFPLKVEFNYDNRCWDITGVSGLFDEVLEGERVPRYEAVLRYDHEKEELNFVEFRKA